MWHVYYNMLLCTIERVLQIIVFTSSHTCDETYLVNCAVINIDVSLHHIKWVESESNIENRTIKYYNVKK